MEELMKFLMKEKERQDKERAKNFRTATELGIRKGDLIIFKDGDVECINNPDNTSVRFKQIAEVRRPIDWIEVEIIKPKRRRKGDK